MSTNEKLNNDVKQLGEKLKGIRIAMMTTVDEEGMLRSRPMATQDFEFDGDLWFFTQASTPKVSEIQEDQQVNLSYAAPDDNCYVSVSGTAQLIRDHQKINELWKPIYKIWFPNGKEDPDLALLKVNVMSAEYWDAPSSKMVLIFQAANSIVTGKQDMGENEKINLK